MVTGVSRSPGTRVSATPNRCSTPSGAYGTRALSGGRSLLPRTRRKCVPAGSLSASCLETVLERISDLRTSHSCSRMTVPGGVSSPSISLLGRHFHRDTRNHDHANATQSANTDFLITQLQPRSRRERPGRRCGRCRSSRERARASEPRCSAVVWQWRVCWWSRVIAARLQSPVAASCVRGLGVATDQRHAWAGDASLDRLEAGQPRASTHGRAPGVSGGGRLQPAGGADDGCD